MVKKGGKKVKYALGQIVLLAIPRKTACLSKRLVCPAVSPKSPVAPILFCLKMVLLKGLIKARH
jgi:hypothetical protein